MSDTERGSRYTGTILEVIRKSNKRDVLQIGINNVVLVRRGLASSRAGLLYVMQSAVNISSLLTGRPVLAGTEDCLSKMCFQLLMTQLLFVSKCIII